MKLLLENWRKFITEDWRDTSWKDDGEEVTIGEVFDYLGDETINIKVSELSQQIPSLFDDEYRQSDKGKTRISAADLNYPIIITKSGGRYKSVLDGNHRLQRAIDEKVEIIKAKILDLDNSETPEVFKRMFGSAE
jgi:hypothetical protein